MSEFVSEWVVPSGAHASPAVYALVAATVMLMIATSKGGFGGLAVAATPLMLTVVDPRTALGILLPLLCLGDAITLPFYPREFRWRPVLTIAPWTMAGILIGWFLLGRVTDATKPWLAFGIGALSLAFAMLDGVKAVVARRVARHAAHHDKPWRPGVFASAPFGLSAGVSTMLAHAAGPITTIYFLLQQLDPRTFVGTTARYYFIFNAIKIPFYVKLGLITGDSVKRSVWLVPVAVAGVWAGAALNRRFSDRGFRALIVVLLLLTGFALVIGNRHVVLAALARE